MLGLVYSWRQRKLDLFYRHRLAQFKVLRELSAQLQLSSLPNILSRVTLLIQVLIDSITVTAFDLFDQRNNHFCGFMLVSIEET